MDLATDPKRAILAAIEERKRPKIAKIQELLTEIDRLEAQITAQKQELKSELQELFETLEAQIRQLPESKRQEAIRTLEECKLQSLEFLGILAETTESAILGALENGQNIQETITEITKDLTHQTIDINVDPKHIKDVSKTIIGVAATIAEASVNYADEILRGAILGTKQGIAKSLAKFNETIEFTPDEARNLIIQNYDEIVNNLGNIELFWHQAIEEVAHTSEPGIKERILKISESTIFDKLKSEAQNVIANIKRSWGDLIAEQPQIKKNIEEAKKLGLRVFAKAKEKIEETIHAINK